MKNYKQKILSLYVLAKTSPKQAFGVVLFFCVPIFHNLHNIFSEWILSYPVPYHQELRHLLWISEHSFAPCAGFLGCFLISDSIFKYFIGIPFGYTLYKGLEKLPIRNNYDVREEYIITGLVIAVIWVPIFYFSDKLLNKINYKLRNSTATLRAITDEDLKDLYNTHGREIIKKEADKIDKELHLLGK